MRVIGAAILGIIFGLLFTTGVYEFLVQNGNLDPFSKVGVAFPIVGVLLGLVVAIFGGRRRRRRKAPKEA
jgi:hypothetical protein